jgi:hypothetical protein
MGNGPVLDRFSGNNGLSTDQFSMLDSVSLKFGVVKGPHFDLVGYDCVPRLPAVGHYRPPPRKV